MAEAPPGFVPASDTPLGFTPDREQPGLLRRGYQGLKSAAAVPFRLAGQADVASGIKSPETAERRAKMYGGLTTDLALTAPFTAGGGALGGLASQALGRGATAIPTAGRILGSAAGGGSQAALEGQPVAKSAVMSGLGAGVGEGANVLIPKGVDVARKLYGRATGSEVGRIASDAARETEKTAAQMAKATLQSQTAHRVGTQAGAVVPGLGGRELHALSAGGEGRKILNDQFAGTLKQIEGGLQANRITKIKVPELADEAMTLREAVDALQLVGRGLGKAAASERSVGQRFAALDYGKAREALMARLNQVSPGTGDQLSAALTQSSRGRAYLKIVGQSLDADGQLDPAKLARNVNKYAGQLQERFGKDWAAMQGVLTGGQALPVAVPTAPAGPAWRPPVQAFTPTPRLGPTGMLAADALLSQPGAREAAVGGALGALPALMRHLPGGHYLEIMELGGG